MKTFSISLISSSLDSIQSILSRFRINSSSHLVCLFYPILSFPILSYPFLSFPIPPAPVYHLQLRSAQVSVAPRVTSYLV